jgi:hypothetical protein
VIDRTARNNLTPIIHRFHHLLGIAKNCDVWIVRNDDDLAAFFRPPQYRD